MIHRKLLTHHTHTLAVAACAAIVALFGSATPATAAGGHILFATHGSLMSVPAEGGATRRLAQVPIGTLDLAASRDGRRIALISNRKLPAHSGSIRSIHLFRPGHGLRRLRQFRSSTPLYIAISPDGRWIAFGQQGEIWLMRANGGGLRQVTDGPSGAWDPAFTPDGQSLIFNRDAEPGPSRRPQLFSQSLSGGPEAQVSDDCGREPAVSSTGLLLYTRPGGRHVDSRLIAVRLDGSRRRTVNRQPFASSATFSPDGRSIAYLRLREKNGDVGDRRYSIHTQTVAGKGHRKVIGGLPSSAPRARFGGHAPAGPVWVPW